MKVNILTLYPDMFPGSLGHSLAGKALAEGTWEIRVTNLRNFATDAYKTVDDTPFGGGAGMVMKPEIIDSALKAVHKAGPIYYLSPRGAVFNQATAQEWARAPEMTFICGRFEGMDERLFAQWPIQEISLGDFVLSGGEPALLAMLDATVRLIPSVLGNPDSLAEESFASGLLEYPHYTKPAVWEGLAVPEVLTSGHHENIRAWRRARAEEITQTRRPDLWTKYLAQHNKKG